LKAKNNQIKYNQLGAYLAGLIEEDGIIYNPRLIVKGYPQIEIAFDIKDVQLANKKQQKQQNHICNWGGKLFIRANGKSCKITFKKSDLLLKVFQFINEYLRTPKIEALH
jgi:hypothetical protein